MESEVEKIVDEMLVSLGYDPKKPPVTISRAEAAKVLDVTHQTLAVWACTGRYPLPVIKVGRNCRYRLQPLAEFMLSRTSGAA